MKILAIFILTFIGSGIGAQDFCASKLFSKIIFEEFTINDTNDNRLSDQELFDLLFQIDTSLNCYYSLALNFNDLTSYSSLVIYLYPVPISISKSSDEKFYDVIRPIYDDQTGVWLTNQFLFKLPNEIVQNLHTVSPQNNDSNLINSKYDHWEIKKINSAYEKIELDTCLLSFQLIFESHTKFTHSYPNGTKCGSDNETNPSFTHHLSYLDGYWKSSDDKLIFANDKFDELIIWEYNIIGNKLTLKRGEDYIIEFEKKSSK